MRTVLIVFILCCSLAKADTFTHAETSLRFPDALAKWKRSKVAQFPDKNLGVEIDYAESGKAIASFYLYTQGVAEIPTGSDNQTVQQEFAKVQAEMESAMRKQFKEVSKFLESAPEIKNEKTGRKATLAVAAIEFTDPKGRRWLSWALITGYKKHFLKLRYTQPFNRNEDIDKGQEMLHGLITAFIEKNEDNANSFWQ